MIDTETQTNRGISYFVYLDCQTESNAWIQHASLSAILDMFEHS
jgi:hypothetical protein